MVQSFKRKISPTGTKRWLIAKIVCKGIKYWKRNGFFRTLRKIHNINFIGLFQEQLKLNNKDGYLPYDSEYQSNLNFSNRSDPDVRMIAFYLPQYHTFPENDKWWGNGFTEWVNVKSGTPQFKGHYQPRVPHMDIGYYHLNDISVMHRQIILAKQHGIYGFCFYYYWFSGKRLMEKPVDMLLEHPEIDIPFCLCWANENWTRTWDGLEKNVLMKQNYSDEDDDQFIVDLKKYIDDGRYIRIKEKPLILVYNPGQIPDPHKSFEKWRTCARKIGVGEILIWTCQTANNTAKILNIEDCVDAEVEFPPHNMWIESIGVRDLDTGGKEAYIYNYQRLVQYRECVLNKENKSSVPVHRSCMLAWDNQARRKNGWVTFYAFSLKSLYRWILSIVDRTRKDFEPEERYAFINAWNEWGEGSYLEPDEKYGYANINTISKALYGIPFYNDLKILDNSSPTLELADFSSGDKIKIAVQAHLYYLDTLDEIIGQLNQIPYSFDCFISTDTKEKREEILHKMRRQCNYSKIQVDVIPNRGRDVAPMLIQLAPVIDNYEYICHIHSKKTHSNDHGDDWRMYLFSHLLGCSEYLKRVFYLFDHNKDLGIIMPETYPVLELQAEWGGNKDGAEILLQRMNCDYILPQTPIFPVGNMFWARTSAVRKVFNLALSQSDFPEEQGQDNGTLAHQIERIWVYVAAASGYKYCKVFNNCKTRKICLNKSRLGIFVHYDKDNIVSNEDMTTINILSSFLSQTVFVTNANLDQKELDKVRLKGCQVKKRKNLGFDFGAWRDVLLEYGQEKIEQFDEIVLVNNSCYAPLFDIREIFAEMEDKDLDFWGNTIFPYYSDGRYLHKNYIPEHLQSYFIVFNKKVLQSGAFWRFWKNVPNYGNLTDVIANCETQLTKALSEAGFSYQPYIRETYYMSRFLNNYSIPYKKPTSLLLLKSAFVKKKCYQYMDSEEKIKLDWMMTQLKEQI